MMPKKRKIKEEKPKIKVIKELSSSDISKLVNTIEEIDEKIEGQDMQAVKFNAPSLEIHEVKQEPETRQIETQSSQQQEAPRRTYSSSFDELDRNTYYKAPVLNMNPMALQDQGVQQQGQRRGISRDNLQQNQLSRQEDSQKDDYQTERQRRRIYPWEV